MTWWLRTVGLGATGILFSGAALDQPNLSLSQESWDFGQVWHGATPNLTLVLKNDGDAELKISEVRSTCGCTHVTPGRTVVPPGQTSELKIVYDTEGKQDKVGSSVIIQSNDPARPKIDFLISGFVKRAVRHIPVGGIEMRTLDPSPGQTATVRLENQVDQPMKLELQSCTVPGLEVELKPVTPGQVYEATVRTTLPLRHGLTNGELIFATGLEREPRFSVSVRIQHMWIADPVPTALYIEPSAPGQAKPHAINLNYYGTLDDFRVTGVICKQKPELQVAIDPARPAGSALAITKIKLIVNTRLQPLAASDVPKGGLVIEYTTNDPACPKVEVPVTTDKKEWELLVYGPGGRPRKSD
jgi:hypothetical protein